MPSEFPKEYARNMLMLTADIPNAATDILRKLDLPLSLLEPQPKGALIPATELSRIMMLVFHCLQVDKLGKEKAKELWELSTYRLMFGKMLGSLTLKESIEWCARFYCTFNKCSEKTVSIEYVGNTVKVVIARSQEELNPHAEMNAAENLSWESMNLLTDPVGVCFSILYLHRIFSWIIGEFIELDGINLLDERSDTAEEILGYCDAPLHTSRNEISFSFSARYLQYKPVHNEDTFLENEHELCLQLLTIDEQRHSLCMKIKTMLGNDFSQGIPSIEWVADRLNLSVTTLYRHLKSEGTTFQRLKDECRLSAAKEYLQAESLVLADVAHYLGFSDISTFYRAFKKWVGMTPVEYKEQLLAHAS